MTLGNPPGSGSYQGQNPSGGPPHGGGRQAQQPPQQPWQQTPQTQPNQPGGSSLPPFTLPSGGSLPSATTVTGRSFGATTPSAGGSYPPSTPTAGHANEAAALRSEIRNLEQILYGMQTSLAAVNVALTGLPRSVAEQLRAAATADQQRAADALKTELEKTRVQKDEAERLAVEAMGKAEQTEKQARQEAQQAIAKAQADAQQEIAKARAEAEQAVAQAKAEAQQEIARVQAEAQQAIHRVNDDLKAETARYLQNPQVPLILLLQERVEAALHQRTADRLAGALQERRPDVPDLFQRADRFLQQVQDLKPALDRVCGGALQAGEYQRVYNECRGVRERARQLGTAPAPPSMTFTVPALPTEELVAESPDGPAPALTAWAVALEQHIKLQIAEYQRAVDQAVRTCLTEPWQDDLRLYKRRLSDSARNLHMLVFNALSQMGESPETQQLLEQANKVVEGVGITPVIPRNEKYDPYEHELAGTVPSAGPKGRVVQVELPGYREGNRMLYKPRVIISE